MNQSKVLKYIKNCFNNKNYPNLKKNLYIKYYKMNIYLSFKNISLIKVILFSI